MKQYLYITVFLFSILGFSQNMALFEQGNTFYNEGKYQDAIKKYEAILETDEHSAELYFNLGNAHYKLNHIAPSVYYYEKALQLKPNDSEIKNNLNFAKNMTLDAIDVIPEVGMSKVLNNVSGVLSFDVWAIIAICFVVLSVVLFINYIMSEGTKTKRFSFTFGFACLFLMLGSLVSAFHKYNLDKADNPAIVFTQESKVKSEPNLRSEEAFRLHEGTKVQVLDTVENWKKIKLTDGKMGWIPSNDIKLLNRF
ncbi:tetratricopeptide repeat protein [Hanstruepera flava]|uniref:tetratricopeptide repeat protein n=1 Tax=Hanstruepera flava TaxID=2930218 RepID=UPI002028E1F9|nr:tetratricopeptide repeat protein [Hanstruepera flava]